VLSLRPIGRRDYSVLDDKQLVGRIRYASERTPGIWIWNVIVHLTGGLPIGTAGSLDQAKIDFKMAWEALKAKTPPDQLLKAYKAMNLRDG
jgi:hypothetical protein